MYKFQIIDLLISSIKNELPGEKAQFNMAAYYKVPISPDMIAALEPRIGAVMILLIWKDEQWNLTLMKRPPYDGIHGGQISFFGGKKEDQDQNLVDTAIREATEEGGQELSQSKLLGALSPLYIQASNFLVHPYIFYTDAIINFEPDKNEVEEIFLIPLLDYFKYKKETNITLKNGISFNAPAYIFDDYVIWGATAMILSELEELLNPWKHD